MNPFKPPQGSATKEPAPPEARPEKHILWREDQLRRAGYDEVQASLIASDRSIDLHLAVKLAAEAGPELATRILI